MLAPLTLTRGEMLFPLSLLVVVRATLRVPYQLWVPSAQPWPLAAFCVSLMLPGALSSDTLGGLPSGPLFGHEARALTGPAQIGLMLCSRHLKTLNTFLFESVL